MKNPPPQHFKTIHKILTEHGGSIEKLHENDKILSGLTKELDIRYYYLLERVEKALKKLEKSTNC